MSLARRPAQNGSAFRAGPVGTSRSARPTATRSSRSKLPNGEEAVNHRRGLADPEDVDRPDTISSILSTVVTTNGTARAAAIPGVFAAGKTGTTENYGDAWFVGWTDKITVAVWVGYPNELKRWRRVPRRAGRRRHVPRVDLEDVRREGPGVRGLSRGGERRRGRRGVAAVDDRRADHRGPVRRQRAGPGDRAVHRRRARAGAAGSRPARAGSAGARHPRPAAGPAASTGGTGGGTSAPPPGD